ncbi:ABC transporter substrate-binding protein [Halanaerobium sp.]|uniref:ABC transporter substrate-binding protein n=1 Tax=Halanaerobium sp. TaxID=1895664 RepID=UPI000DE7180C|nr:extracellular solute-binding protein [Halanaerobium sp.]PUU94949.1 MAG: lactose/L-arabinose transport system substrate-binding protein [Halanaerobium sp.]
MFLAKGRKVIILSFVLVLGFLLAATAVNAETVELNMWTFVNAHAEFFEMKAEEYNQAQSDVTLKLKTQTLPYDQMHDKLNVALQTGMGAPDIVDIEIAKFPGIVANSVDKLVDLTSVTDKYKDEIVTARLAPYSSLEGKVYGIPTHIGTAVIYYNQELFKEAGVSVDDIKTWEDYVEVGKKLTKDTDGDGEIDQWMAPVAHGSAWPFHLMSRQFGSNSFDEDGNIILDRKENIKVLQFLQDLVYKHKIGNVMQDYHQQNFYDVMNSGKYASVLPMPQWYMIRFTDFMPDLKGKILVRPMPAWSSGGTLSATGGGTGTAITKQANNIEVAKDFLAFAKLTEKAGVQIWTELGFDPIRKDAYNHEELYEPLPYFGNERVMNTIKSLQSEIQPLYLTGLYPKVQDILGEEVLFKTIEQNKDVEKALKDAAETLRSE